MTRKVLAAAILFVTINVIQTGTCRASEMPQSKEYTNSVGMKFVRIEPGTFMMGVGKTPLDYKLLPKFRGRGLTEVHIEGDFDEKPNHKVKITEAFHIGIYEVTNFQYELFDPGHKSFRGKEGYSNDDDEAVHFVNWYDAQAFCRW
ncbi:MAG: formylglycine-generating enzyme family protein, partial [Planctomycetota bacterium]